MPETPRPSRWPGIIQGLILEVIGGIIAAALVAAWASFNGYIRWDQPWRFVPLLLVLSMGLIVVGFPWGLRGTPGRRLAILTVAIPLAIAFVLSLPYALLP